MSNKVEITRALFKQALREGDFRLAASDMNYENNRNLKDTNLSSAEITPIMVSRVSREKSRQLKRRFATAIIALFLTFLAVASATYAWYIYNTSRHTTNVRMAAGAGVNLQISNAYNGTYGSAAVLDSFAGQLVPVSTNRITGGFQKVLGFTEGNSQSGLVASIFGSGEQTDYYHTSLFLRTNGSSTDIYVSNIGYEDSDEANPISSAIRVGLVVHRPGQNQSVAGEYIFEISDKKNPEADYNTATGEEGYVLNSSSTDGSTISFSPYTSASYCEYDQSTGTVTLKNNSLKLCNISGAEDGTAGTPVEIEIYIWLEGCDEDCTLNLCSQTLRNLAVSFAGVTEQ